MDIAQILQTFTFNAMFLCTSLHRQLMRSRNEI